MSTGCSHPYLPEGLRRKAFTLTHNLFHPSGWSTTRIIAEWYIWWGMKKDIKNWMRECISCQTSKITRHLESRIEEFQTTHCQLTHIHLDIVGPSGRGTDTCSPSSSEIPGGPKQYRYGNRWQTLRESPHQMGQQAQIITSNRGANFTSTLWNALADSLG
ncbi:uncharacterized protein [Macrobrachium rosenbergii]|uniref:uncharacterized protein n=1 Tax=Macrobrachium rosenbergii TaxID=79674 RepID=UPI0034D426CE